MTQFVSETRERFIVAIAEQVAADRIAEIHFFKPIRQGGLESGVAVLACHREPLAPCHPEQREGSASDEGEFAPESVPGETQVRRVARDDENATRHTVFTAHYRHTLKGVDRGKWQVTVVEEADAPLITVETVVRGVQRRAGDIDDPEKMEGDAVREVLAAAAARAGS